MRRFVTVVICTFLLATPASAGPPLRLPALTRIASKVSGLRAKSRPQVVVLGKTAMQQQAVRLLDRDYPPDQQAYDETLYHALGLLPANAPLRPLLLAETTRNVLGLYDPATRTLYVKAGPGRKTTLLHELVHALQDQAFDL